VSEAEYLKLAEWKLRYCRGLTCQHKMPSTDSAKDLAMKAKSMIEVLRDNT